MDNPGTLPARGEQARRGAASPAVAGGAHEQAEHRMRTVFQCAPVPMILVGRDGIIRLVNAAATDLLGCASSYPKGKHFTAFVAMPHRALAQTHLAAATRTGALRRFRCGVLESAGVVDCELSVSLVPAPAGAGQLIIAVTRLGDPPRPPGPGQQAASGPATAGSPDVMRVTEAMTRRLDVVTAAARLLLDTAAISESATIHQFARLLARELGSWVMVDLARRKELGRHCVAGPDDAAARDLARAVAAIDPGPGSAPHKVFESGSSLLVTHAEDVSLLDGGRAGVPLLMMLGATSVLSVPLSAGEQQYGVLTLARPASSGRFGMADVAMVEELSQQLALAMRAHRSFRQRAEAADALQASLVPHEVRQIPGAQVAALHLAATEDQVVGSDFYDVYPSPDGWGLAIGDVCGMADGSAGVTAAARHAIRVLAHWNPDPAAVLSGVNDIMLAEELGGQFVTAAVTHLRWQGETLRAVYASAGHPGGLVITSEGLARPLRGGGLPLGIFEDAEPTTQEVLLAPGDLLFLYTDGVTGAGAPDTVDFEDRLADELLGMAGSPAAEVVARIRDLVQGISDGVLHDNLTVLALRPVGPPLPA